jgi:cell division transport system permease protein
MGSFSLLALNVDRIIDTLEHENQILVFIDETYTEDQARALEASILSVPNVARVEYVSRDEALESFKALYDDSSMLQDLDPDVLRDRYIVFLDDLSLMSQTQETLKNIEGIDKVNAHLEISEGFVRVRNIVSAISVILVAVLLIISLFIMSNTIKLTTFDRREEIAIMKMVGATSSFIRWPFVVEGLILGVTGAAIAFLAQWGFYEVVTRNILTGTGLSFVSVIPFSSVALYISVIFLALGLGVGVFGSITAIKNYLKV